MGVGEIVLMLVIVAVLVAGDEIVKAVGNFIKGEVEL